MAVTFKPKYLWVVPFNSTNNYTIKADNLEVISGGALVFTAVGSDGKNYITKAFPPQSYISVAFDHEITAGVDVSADKLVSEERIVK